jgi:hypothetical protein
LSLTNWLKVTQFSSSSISPKVVLVCHFDVLRQTSVSAALPCPSFSPFGLVHLQTKSVVVVVVVRSRCDSRRGSNSDKNRTQIERRPTTTNNIALLGRKGHDAQKERNGTERNGTFDVQRLNTIERSKNDFLGANKETFVVSSFEAINY